MTIKEAVLKSLDELNIPSSYTEVYDHIVKNSHYAFTKAKTPTSTISAILGSFITNGDTRLKRIKPEGGAFLYYLTKNEDRVDLEVNLSKNSSKKATKNKIKTYNERSLHKLLSSFLKEKKTYSKTIFHEQSKYGKDNNQIWTHPDMVGINFLKLHTKVSQNFLKSINRVDTFKLNSYEIKKEINSDTELKKAYFQAVSNSSWANYGYLVAFEFSDNLSDEMERLNQSFGIGIIKLNENPYQSEILFPSRYRELDFKTIDKLCKMNNEFESFIKIIEKLMTASDKYVSGTEKELEDFSDEYFENDSEVEKYCKENNIPIEEDGGI